jgi:hypothetical protein
MYANKYHCFSAVVVVIVVAVVVPSRDMGSTINTFAIIRLSGGSLVRYNNE